MYIVLKGLSEGGEDLTDFDSYAERYSRDLTRFCLKLCGDTQDAEDLFQDTWVRAFDKIDRYDSEKSFKTWLFAICVNIYKNSGRSKYNTSRLSFRTTEEKERFLNSVPDDEKDLDAYIALHAALSELPKKHRAVIILFYFREFTQKEISEILNIPEGTVKSRLNTAKGMLKRRLDYDR